MKKIFTISIFVLAFSFLPVFLSLAANQSAIGLYEPNNSVFFLKNSNTSGIADKNFNYGPGTSGWLPVAGDWNGDGTVTVGLYNPATSTFFLKNSNSSGIADLTFQFGPVNSGWLPVAGDWNGDEITTIGLYNPATSIFYLKNTNSSGNADLTFQFGPANSGWKPIAGDWDGNRTTTVGLYNPATSTFYLKNTNSSGNADLTFGYGPANSGWKPIVGDWDGNGTTTVGLYEPGNSVFFLRNSNTSGVADLTFNYGPANSGWTPVAGSWNGTCVYKVVTLNVGTAADKIEYDLYCGAKEFMAVIMDGNNAISTRPAPGLDPHGWGSSMYLQPFFPGAILHGTNIPTINPTSSGINVAASGIVSEGNSGSYGSWTSNLSFSYNPSQKEITGSGTYNITLSGALSASTGDLNICKLASNYLVLPTGNTGDMTEAIVTGGTAPTLTWIPSSGSTYPSDIRNPMSIQIVGNYNQADTPPAYKPTMTVGLNLTNQTSGYSMTFGGFYDKTAETDPKADNVGITPLILKSSTPTSYNFNVTFDSTAIAGDH